MKIYTKKGDNGTTRLIGGSQVPKHHPRVESYGAVDELNSWIGLLRNEENSPITKNLLLNIQNQLFTIGSHLANASLDNTFLPELSENEVLILEQEIDFISLYLPKITHFILPGGHNKVSYIHIARTVCRRSERELSKIIDTPTDKQALKYLNRLSDYLFVYSRKVCSELGVKEIKWKS